VKRKSKMKNKKLELNADDSHSHFCNSSAI
jgi:hypothetical protein